LHMAQLMSLPLTVSCFSKIQIGFSFLVPAHLGRSGKGAVKRVCVCVVGPRIGYVLLSGSCMDPFNILSLLQNFIASAFL